MSGPRVLVAGVGERALRVPSPPPAVWGEGQGEGQGTWARQRTLDTPDPYE